MGPFLTGKMFSQIEAATVQDVMPNTKSNEVLPRKEDFAEEPVPVRYDSHLRSILKFKKLNESYKKMAVIKGNLRENNHGGWLENGKPIFREVSMVELMQRSLREEEKKKFVEIEEAEGESKSVENSRISDEKLNQDLPQTKLAGAMLKKRTAILGAVGHTLKVIEEPSNWKPHIEKSNLHVLNQAEQI